MEHISIGVKYVSYICTRQKIANTATVACTFTKKITHCKLNFNEEPLLIPKRYAICIFYKKTKNPHSDDWQLTSINRNDTIVFYMLKYSMFRCFI